MLIRNRIKKHITIPVLILAMLLSACGCGKKEAAAENAKEAPATPPVIVVNSEESEREDHTEEQAQSVLSTMSLENKIAQMIMPAIRVWGSDDPKPVTELNDELGEVFRRHGFGGVILFAQNLNDPAQTVNLINALQEANASADGRMPLMIAADQEGGSVVRLAEGTEGPGNMALGAIRDPASVKSMSKIIGKELSAQGFHVDFAPVLDVNSDPSNPVIGIRSFSDDPQTVADCGKAFISGLQEENVITAVKHFPGHGDTDTDSHAGLPCIDKPMEELQRTELIPFAECLPDTDMVMTAHIEFPQIEQGTYISKESGEEILLPATLSKAVITDLLRNDLQYDGVVITDSMEMGAISKHFDRTDAAKLAINAGADMLLMPVTMRSADEIEDMERYLDDIKALVETGEIKEERINEAVLRILRLKIRHGLLSGSDQHKDETPAMEITGCKEHRDVEWDLACRAVTLLKSDGMTFPCMSNGKTVILISDEDEREAVEAGLNRLRDEGLQDPDADIDIVCYAEKETDTSFVSSADRIIAVSVLSKRTQLDASHKDGAGAAFLDAVMKASGSGNKKLVFISAGLPYDTARYQDADVILACYHDRINLSAAIYTAFCKDSATGKLPVAVPKLSGQGRYSDRILYENGYAYSTVQYKDVTLGDEQFDAYIPLLSGKRVALFSNQTGIVGDAPPGQHILDALIAHGANVTVAFSPEHGFRGTADAGAGIDNAVDEKTGVPVLSLFRSGSSQSPPQDSMDRFDTLVVDIQEVGLRYYTYYISMYYLMDACAKNNKEVIILDRPNPNGSYVDGPVLKEGFQSGVGKLPLPVVYGMTIGELAGMINGEGWLTDGRKCQLKVIPCLGYTHETKTRLICNPSPNLKDMRAVFLYASTCFFENTAVSVARGTRYPFAAYGSPYFSDILSDGFHFTPQSMSGAKNPPFQGQTCYGYDLREKPVEEILDEGICLDYLIDAYTTMQEVHPEVSFFGTADKNGHYWIDLLSGSDELRKMIVAGKSAQEIKASWQGEISEFLKLRAPYLLYP
ncbi:MAG: DUF1343 domain-containing protein [Clostridiales bacterium]|nr:DUF1343 domain-containing protein [Clostridiales bacterium]